MSNTKTPEAIKQDENFICGVELTDFNLNVYMVFALMTNGNDITIEYYAFLNSEILFTGTDYKPSPLIGPPTELPCIIDLLGFLTLQRGAAPQEYFKNYTEAQINWRDSSDCEHLEMWVGDFKYPKNEAYKESATKYFTQFFIS